MEALAAHAEGVIALTGCLAVAHLQRRIVEGRARDARAHLDDLIQAFGPEQVYFEVQKNGIAEQDRANEGIVQHRARARPPARRPPATSTTCAARTTTTTTALLCVQTKSDARRARS